MGAFAIPIAVAATSAVKGLSDNGAQSAQYTLANGQAIAQDTLNSARVDANNAVRQANNLLSQSQAALQNGMRSIANNERLRTWGKQSETIDRTAMRLGQAAIRGTLESQLRASSQLGALSSQAALQGVGGGSVGALRSVMANQQAYVKSVNDRNYEQKSFDMLQQKMGLAQTAIAGTDVGQTIANIDYSRDVFTPTIKPTDPSNNNSWFAQGVMSGLGTLFGSGLLGNSPGSAGGALSNLGATPNFTSGLLSGAGGITSFGGNFLSSNSGTGLLGFGATFK